jgi:thiol-disulfide isomerase/thioredoxin
MVIFILLASGDALFNPLSAQEARVIKWDEFEKLTLRKSDTTYIFNFWATWCKPCIRELPYFNSLQDKFQGKKIKIYLVSLDFRRQFETVLVPFLKKNNIREQVMLLDEPDYNLWIDRVDPSWSGAIPATLVVNNSNGIRKLYEMEFTEETLTQTLKPLIP